MECFFTSAGMSEDSDYTSDINYPLSHQHNSSAHQFRGEPNYPIHHDDGRDYGHDYEPYDDSFDRDEREDYRRQEDFDHMDSFDRRGSSGPEDTIWYEGRGDSIERTESFEQEYFESDQSGYGEQSDTEYDPSIHGRYHDGDEYDRQVRDYDARSHHSSNRGDYDSEKEYGYSHEDYQRTITNEESLHSDKSRRYDSHYDSYFDSPESVRKLKNYTRNTHNHSHELDYLHSPKYDGRSDPDIDMSYNSRPYPRPPMSTVSSSHRQG